jgi:hypothetical protein
MFRKFLSTNKLCEINEIVGETARLMLNNESKKPFLPFNYINNMFIRIIIKVFFGKTLDFNCNEIHKIIDCSNNLQMGLIRTFLSEHIPILKRLINIKKPIHTESFIMIMFTKWFNELNKLNLNFQTTSNSLCESYILVANNYRRENVEKEKYITDDSMIGNLLSLYEGLRIVFVIYLTFNIQFLLHFNNFLNSEV